MAKYDVAAYVWPAYTPDEPRTRMFWPEGMGEWQSVKNSVRKYEGHSWPRKPLWGYVNEADPYVMEMEIEAAVDHGINTFIYDWYWYDGRPFLENCLNDGFLKAKNRNKMKFFLMWANHDANSLWDIRLSRGQDNVIWRGAVDRAEFERICRRLIGTYFKQPNYYCIDGKPVFMIYDLTNLVTGLGGYDKTAQALGWFEEEARRAGLAGVYYMLTMWSEKAMNYSGVDSHSQTTGMEVCRKLGFKGMTHYQFVHFAEIDRDYEEILKDAEAEWKRIEANYQIPYYPHVSVGWDNNPRFLDFRPGVMKNNTPEAVEKAFRMAKAYVDSHPEQAPLITVNSWNEWTETSYLEPDDLYGYGYLEAAGRVFGPQTEKKEE